MTFTSSIYGKPKDARLASELKQLIVKGQGIVFFDASGPCSFSFHDASGTSGLHVEFTKKQILVHMRPSNEPLIDISNTTGIVNQRGAYYWVSLDAQNQCIYAGIGEARKETAIYTYTHLTHAHKPFLESLHTIKVEGLTILRILRDPITGTVPLLVKPTEELTMDMIAAGQVLPKANLSLTSQKLYDCISGKQFKLNTPDFPDFTKAIEYSLATPGKWCYERIKQKATEFNKDKPNIKETYLRITLGKNNGESPGIPYVMEIWPVGHYSPIHNHGGSSAIIRVLHGAIDVSLFPFLSPDAKPFATKEFKKEDVTWISPALNQIHQLKNKETNKDTAITIQCYMYEDSDTSHYDYFDYLNDSDQGQFEPDSDMEFLAFKEILHNEWWGGHIALPLNHPFLRNFKNWCFDSAVSR
jgi:hypothetical protein